MRQRRKRDVKPDKTLIDAIYRERVLRARAQPPEEKLLAGIRLFDSACRVMKEGIRAQYPEADEERVNEILRERLAIARRLEGK
ncbi:MAG: hypothetical protein AB1696_10595 [Planctomycetota bacterium]